jgi:hypothetical protein
MKCFAIPVTGAMEIVRKKFKISGNNTRTTVHRLSTIKLPY